VKSTGIKRRGLKNGLSKQPVDDIELSRIVGGSGL